jgi:[ribosomal protein S18]-alanine N-acetyltransferase
MSFEPIWRLSMDDLRFAINKSTYCTVIERAGTIVGYQISSSAGIYGHLARLAVSPDLQGQGLGFALVQDVLEFFIFELTFWGVTLNTQHNNHSSIALYQRVGFHETGERFPVFTYPLP